MGLRIEADVLFVRASTNHFCSKRIDFMHVLCPMGRLKYLRALLLTATDQACTNHLHCLITPLGPSHLSVNQSINQSIIQRRRDNTHRVLTSTSSSENSGITNPILSHQNCTMKILVFDLQESSCSLPSSRSTSPCFLRPHQTSSLEFSPRHVPVPSRSKGASADGQREKIDTPL
jgi:hypothetical protein